MNLKGKLKHVSSIPCQIIAQLTKLIRVATYDAYCLFSCHRMVDVQPSHTSADHPKQKLSQKQEDSHIIYFIFKIEIIKCVKLNC
jgi:hypothetical protein